MEHKVLQREREPAIDCNIVCPSLASLKGVVHLKIKKVLSLFTLILNPFSIYNAYKAFSLFLVGTHMAVLVYTMQVIGDCGGRA